MKQRITITLRLLPFKWRCSRAEKGSKNLAILHFPIFAEVPLSIREIFASSGIFFKQIYLILPLKSKYLNIAALISITSENSKCASTNSSSSEQLEIKLSSNLAETVTLRSSRLISLSNPLKDGGGIIKQCWRVRCLNCTHLKSEEGNLYRLTDQSLRTRC